MSRPTLLSLTLALLIPSALAPAQTPNTSITQNPKPQVQTDTVLFDFDNGNYDGWTLSGDCWDAQPATAKTFVDRQGAPLVSGIVGKGYLTTLFKSAATTGKAVSKDFTIDKPFLTFRIGGGYYQKKRVSTSSYTATLLLNNPFKQLLRRDAIGKASYGTDERPRLSKFA